MQKPIEERLADIESGITNLTKVQGYTLRVLLILHRKSALIERSQRAITSIKEDIEPVHRLVNYSLAFIFGMVAVMGVSVSMYSIYFVTQHLAYRVASIGLGAFAFSLGIYAYLQQRRARSQLQGVEKTVTQTGENIESVEKKLAAADDALAQALAEWREMASDDSVSKFINDTLWYKDSHDRS